jgi:hypothetical protein
MPASDFLYMGDQRAGNLSGKGFEEKGEDTLWYYRRLAGEFCR